MPSSLDRALLNVIRATANPVAINNNGYSRLRMLECMLSGTMTAVAPNTSAILVMLEPIALPMARPVLPPYAAMLATSISGAEVPKPTMVSPIMRGDIPKLRAVDDAPNTNKSALQMSIAKPAKMATTSRKIESVNIDTVFQ